MDIKVGEYYTLYYNKGNFSNTEFQIRGIVDNEVVVILPKNGWYVTKDRVWFDMNEDSLTKLRE
jgi:hypothetical protein